MDILDETRFVERLQFFNGQQLFASDLQGIESFDRAMRWLHNRSLHQPGVGNGLAVSAKRGDRQVSVQPGLALDARGAEIVLVDTHDEQVPPVAGEADGEPVVFDLTVSYPSDDDLEVAERRQGVCLDSGVVRRRERPVFCWVRLKRDAAGVLRALDPVQAADIQAGWKIVVARAEVQNCRLAADISVAQRRRARPPTQPLVRCGTTRVEWRRWSLGGSEAENALAGLEATVDTSGAGFRVTPCYSARVAGARPLIFAAGDGGQLAAFDLTAYVQDARCDGFTCYVPVYGVSSAVSGQGLASLFQAASDAWQVTWLGIEG